MNFGEKFRTKHSSLSGSMSKAELDTYAEKLESKINEATFDKEHDTLFVKNSTLTKEQIDYLQLKLNIHIYRLDQEKIGLNPFESCDIKIYVDGLADVFVQVGIPFIVATLFVLLVAFNMPLPMPTIKLNICLFCTGALAILIVIGGPFLLRNIIFNYKNKKYIKALQESNEI